jgi:hypothetical protein
MGGGYTKSGTQVNPPAGERKQETSTKPAFESKPIDKK